MTRADFYIGNPEQYFEDPNDKRLRDIHSIRIKESDSSGANYTTIDTVRFNHGERMIGTHNASGDIVNHFYRLEFISDPNEVDDNGDPVEPTIYFRSEPVLPEATANIVDDVREWLGDTDLENPAWTDQEYIQAIRFALRQWKGERNFAWINEEDIVPVQLLVRESFALELVWDHAKYKELKTPSHSLNKWEIGQHFQQVAEALREQFKTYSQRLNMDNGGYNEDMIITQMPSPKVETATRFSRTEGHYVTSREPYFRRRKFIDYPSEPV